MTDENKDSTPAEPVEVSPDATKSEAPVEFDPTVVEQSRDDGTTRADGLDNDSEDGAK